MKTLFRTTLAFVIVVTTCSSYAATDSTSFAVKLSVTSICDISTVPATDIDFGSNNSKSTSIDSTGTLTVNCTNGTPYDIGLNAGANDNGGQRRMLGQDSNNSTVYVPYQLYTNSGRSTIWGNDIGTNTYSGTGSGDNQAITVYARVPSANFVAGDYLDTVTATITY